MSKTSRRRLLSAVPVAAILLVGLAVSAYACTNYVGVLSVWGNVVQTSGSTFTTYTIPSGNPVVVTGTDSWNDYGAMTQSVNSTVVYATKYTSGTSCGSNRGCFAVKTSVSGSNSFNRTNTEIWYDVNTIPVGYTSHTTWGGDPTYDCMDWNNSSSGVKNVGSVQIATSGLIRGATNGTRGSGYQVAVSNDVAGPFFVATNETAANTSPQESAVCLSDATSVNGNQAPITLL